MKDYCAYDVTLSFNSTGRQDAIKPIELSVRQVAMNSSRTRVKHINLKTLADIRLPVQKRPKKGSCSQKLYDVKFIERDRGDPKRIKIHYMRYSCMISGEVRLI